MFQLKPHPSWMLGTLSVLTLLALWPALQGNRQLQSASAEWRAQRQDIARKQIAIAHASSALGQAELLLLERGPAPLAGAAAAARVSPALDSLERMYRAGSGLSLQEERHLADLRDAGAAYRAAMTHGVASAERPVAAELAALERSAAAAQLHADRVLADSSQAARRLVYGALAATLAIIMLAVGIAWHGTRSSRHG
jgi:hypothetical protein